MAQIAALKTIIHNTPVLRKFYTIVYHNKGVNIISWYDLFVKWLCHYFYIKYTCTNMNEEQQFYHKLAPISYSQMEESWRSPHCLSTALRAQHLQSDVALLVHLPLYYSGEEMEFCSATAASSLPVSCCLMLHWPVMIIC